MAKRAFSYLLFFVLIYSVDLNGQNFILRVEHKPLNEVLTHLIKEQNAAISFNDKALSVYYVSMSAEFESVEQAVGQLIENLPLEMEIKSGVIIIYGKQKSRNTKTWTFSGRVIEAQTAEPLPYSNIIINDKGTVSDLMGNFSFTSENDSVFNIKVSHLGYFILDTSIVSSQNLKFELKPASVGLSEIEIKGKLIEKTGQYGMKPGLIKLNHKVANFLPGYGDNSVFNLLRLQPGILASGEQTNGLIIWGSYEGHSKVVFDGFTIYGLKNFNDNISSFNPLMAKDIEINKGGYDATMGDRVGGIVNVSGKMGSIGTTKFIFSANNMTLNALLEIPIAKKSSLVLAFRNTYYELYDQNDLAFLIRRNNDADTSNDLDLNIKPDYKFRDMNIKFSTRLGKNDDLFYVSFYGGLDKFSYNIDETLIKYQLLKDTKEENSQSGASVFYGKRWTSKSISNFNFSYSSIRSQFFDNFRLIPANINNTIHLEDKYTDNRLSESSLKIDNILNVSNIHKLEYGAEILSNRMTLVEDTFNINYLNLEKRSPRLNLYAQDNIAVGKKLSFKTGLRFTHAASLKGVYFDPRLSLKYQVHKNLKINLAWGIYHQFVARSSVVDDNGNYKYLWTVSDNIDVPVLEAQHFVFGSAFNLSGFTLSIEAYYKLTWGLTRYIRSDKYNIQDIFNGKSKSYGLDVLLKQDIKSHSFWISYSLGKTEELFEYFLNGRYRRAPQDQRHELKFAGLLNFDPWFFSADYVYGSGFPDFIYNQQQSNINSHIYSRLDISLVYKFLNRKLKGEIGLSVLNVLNRENFKLANFERIPANQTNDINIYAEAIPFTPTLYLKIYL
jgi:hypothetical protein